MKNSITFLVLSFAPFMLALSEPSVLGNNNLGSENKTIINNKLQISRQNIQINEMKESIDGIRSVVDSLSLKIGQIGQQVNYKDANTIEQSSKRLKDLEDKVDKLEQIQIQNYQKIEEVLKNLSVMIDKINSSYVSKDEVATLNKLTTKSTKTKVKTKSNAQLLKDAITLYRKKDYLKARDIFLTLAKTKSYKPAQVHYYLGEIAYYQKQDSEAIVYFKKSVSFYDKASYMPTLLLHTAVSFKRLRDKSNAKKFFTLLIENYPDSDQAKIARKHLAKFN